MGTLDDLKNSVGLAGIEHARDLSDLLLIAKQRLDAAKTDKEKADAARQVADAEYELERAAQENRARFKLHINGWTGT
ncbi:MAG: hypothetical protein AB7F22_07765 [Reyranella sp.]|uniref:hypothetical protein n=1 Tax=Reyranella sp. TaxID=1929291 RepID=UPI003D0AF217